MSTVKLDSVKAYFLSTLCRSNEVILESFDRVCRQSLGTKFFIIRGAFGRPFNKIVRRSHSGMVQLNDRMRSVLIQAVRQPFQAIQVIVAPHA